MGTTPEITIDPTDNKTLATTELAHVVKESIFLPATELTITIEDLFRLGQFDTALLESKNVLTEKCTAIKMTQLDGPQKEKDFENNNDVMIVDTNPHVVDITLKDHLISSHLKLDTVLLQALTIYLQCIYELTEQEGSNNELHDCATILQLLAPLPFRFGIIWIKLLIQAHEVPSARIMLVDLKTRMRMATEEGSTTEWLIQKYTEVLDIYIFDVMINSETAFSEIIEDISQDTILCASTKQHYMDTMNTYCSMDGLWHHSSEAKTDNDLDARGLESPTHLNTTDDDEPMVLTTRYSPTTAVAMVGTLAFVTAAVAATTVSRRIEVTQWTNRMKRLVFKSSDEIKGFLFGT